MIGVLWAYEGWQYVTFSAGETRDPQRIFPRAITAATAALVAIYLLANWGYLAALGASAVGQSNHVAADAVGTILGSAAGKIVGALILVSIFSATNGLFLTAPRMYYAMARDGIFFERLAAIHPRFETPAFAIVAIAAWSILLAATGTFEQLLTYVVFTGWVFYALGALSIFAYRRRAPRRRASLPRSRLSGDATAVRSLRSAPRVEHDRDAAGARWRRHRRGAPRRPCIPHLAPRARRRQSHAPLSDAPAVS